MRGLVISLAFLLFVSIAFAIVNGCFDNSLSGWSTNKWGSYSGDVIWDNGRARLRVYRCYNVELYQDFIVSGDKLTFDWETKADCWYESPGYKLIVEGNTVVDKGLRISCGGHYSGTKTIEIDPSWKNKQGQIVFRVYQSGPCRNSDHGNTYLWVDDVAEYSAPTLVSVSNNAPIPIKGGNQFTISPTVADAESDNLYFYCRLDFPGANYSTTVCAEGNTSYPPPYSDMNCTVTAPSDDTNHSYYCRIYDGEFYSSESNTTITTDTTPPNITFSSPSGTVSSEDQALQLTTDENCTCKYSTDNTISYPDMTLFTNTNSTNHSTNITASEGENKYYILCNDTAGNLMREYHELSFTFVPPLETVSNTSTTDENGIASVFLDITPIASPSLLTIRIGSQTQTKSFSSDSQTVTITVQVLVQGNPVSGKKVEFEVS